MLPATSARHLSIVRPRMAYPPIRIRGLRGASLVRSFPVTSLCMIQAIAKTFTRNPLGNSTNAKPHADAKRFCYGTTKGNHLDDQQFDRNAQGRSGGIQTSR